jgi:hypothetical protein
LQSNCRGSASGIIFACDNRKCPQASNILDDFDGEIKAAPSSMLQVVGFVEQ